MFGLPRPCEQQAAHKHTRRSVCVCQARKQGIPIICAISQSDEYRVMCHTKSPNDLNRRNMLIKRLFSSAPVKRIFSLRCYIRAHRHTDKDDWLGISELLNRCANLLAHRAVPCVSSVCLF